MPLIPFTEIVSCSSEDRVHRAENLLKPEQYKKWSSSSSDDDEISCVLQLEKPSTISSVDIGNDGSAFIELLVAKSDQSAKDQWTALLPPTSLMSINEARSDTNRNHVKLLKSSDLNSKALNEKWDLVKIICQQTFQRATQFGLCFVKIYSSSPLNDESNQTSTTSKKVLTINDDEDENGEEQSKIGSFFAKKQAEKRQNIVETNPSAEIRALSTVADQLLSKNPMTDDEIQVLLKKKTQETATPRTTKRLHDDEENEAKPSSHSKKRATVDKSQLMKDVVFVLSGFQNPLRSELRSKASALGATYSDDWNGECTHLICAFPNTPKFVQVQKSKQGIIVNKQWILDCHEKSQLLSESNYQFDGTKKSESSTRKSTKVLNFDDENEDDAENQTTSTTMKTTSSRSVEPKRPSRKQIETFDDQDDSSSDEEPKRKLDSNVYDADTDEDEPATKKRRTFQLENFFHDKHFYIFDDEFNEATIHDLRRVVYAYDGVLEKRLNKTVDFLITNREWNEAFDKISKNYPQLKFVQLNWIQRCHDENKFVPIENFLTSS